MVDCDTDALEAAVQLESRLPVAESRYALVTARRDGVAHHVYWHAPRRWLSRWDGLLEGAQSTLTQGGQGMDRARGAAETAPPVNALASRKAPP